LLKNRFDDKMSCKYTLHSDLDTRLNNTICRLDGMPVYVKVSSPTDITLYEVENRNAKVATISPNDPRFDISHMDLGYMNWDMTKFEGQGAPNRVVYLQRSPSKKYKQGTCGNHTTACDLTGKPSHYSASDVLYTKGFVDSILGNFPKLSDLKVGQLALSQDVAAETDELGLVKLYYRGTAVAYKLPNDSKLHTLRNDMSWVIDRFLGDLE